MILTLLAAISFADPPAANTTVGMSGSIRNVILPSPEVEAVPITDKRTPVVVWIDETYPHGTQFRYDISYYGLEPGKHDLKKYLRRKDGGSMADYPTIPVEVASVLPDGHILPNELAVQPPPFLGGYRTLMYSVIALWFIGLFVILFWGRRSALATMTGYAKPVTVADRLRPLVERGIAGTLTRGEQAALERTLLALWRKRLDLENADPGMAAAKLRSHPDSGPLVVQLEEWLHKPETNPENIDIEELLKPYRNIAASEFDAAQPKLEGATA